MKLFFLLSFILSLPLQAITITDPWIKAVPPNMKMSAAYMVIKNTGNKKISLVSVTSDIAEYNEIHTHYKKNDVMRMRQVKKIVIAANKSVSLKPKSFHIMLIQLKRKIHIGDKIKLELTFSNGAKIKVLAPVKKMF